MLEMFGTEQDIMGSNTAKSFYFLKFIWLHERNFEKTGLYKYNTGL